MSGRRTWLDLPPMADLGGYIYVIAFGTGTIKAGRTKDPQQRMTAHRTYGRTIGTGIVRWWFSPEHEEWRENERALMRLALDLGGTRHAGEYFTGIQFEEMTAKASRLSFTAPEPPATPVPLAPVIRFRAPGKVPIWFRRHLEVITREARRRSYSEAENVRFLADEILCDPYLTQLAIHQYARQSLREAIKRDRRGEPDVLPPAPEPPEPPLAGARARGLLHLVLSSSSQRSAA